MCDGSIWDVPRGDIVITCELDSQDERPGRPSTEQLLDGGDLAKYNGCPLVCPTWANRYFVAKWPGPVFFYHNADPQYRKVERTPNIPVLEPTVPMVGFHAVALAKYLGADRVDLYGFDCAVHEDRHHSENFPLDGWEENLEDHFAKHRHNLMINYGGYVGHENAVNYSPLSAIREPHFNARMYDDLR